MTFSITITARRLALAVPVALAFAAAWWFTHDRVPAATAATHDHSAMTTASANAPVAISDADARRIGVTFATATRGTLSRDIQLVGQVAADPARISAVALKVDGTVERLFADFVGRAVRRGEPLLTVYSPMLVSAQEELLVAQRLQQSLARGASDASGGATTLLASARQRLENWDIAGNEIAMVEEHGMVHRTLTLPSPVTGVLLEKNVVAGQPVMAGQVLFRVADLGQVWVEGDVFEQDLALVRIGQTVTVEFRALADVRRTGRVASFEPVLDPVTRTARVRVVLANGDGALRPGMLATLHLAGPAPTPTLVVPRGAVLSTGERSLVFVKRADGRFEPREVVVGLADDAQVQVLRGLAAGDVVVASATFLVDAESNLGASMGGMGDMPGMDMTAPKPLSPKKDTASPSVMKHDMKGMPPMAEPAAPAHKHPPER